MCAVQGFICTRAVKVCGMTDESGLVCSPGVVGNWVAGRLCTSVDAGVDCKARSEEGEKGRYVYKFDSGDWKKGE